MTAVTKMRKGLQGKYILVILLHCVVHILLRQIVYSKPKAITERTKQRGIDISQWQGENEIPKAFN